MCRRAQDAHRISRSCHYWVKQGGGFVTAAGDQASLVAYRNTAYARLGQLLKELNPPPTAGDE